MIVEIMQSHVETGKWYLQHQPAHPKGLMLSSPRFGTARKSAQVSDPRFASRTANSLLVLTDTRLG